MFNENKENKKSRINIKKLFIVVGVLFLMLVCFLSGVYFSQKSRIIRELTVQNAEYIGEVVGKYSKEQRRLSSDISFDLFWDVWDALEEEYVDKGQINEKEMFYGAIKGMVDSLGDPYTVFMDPKLAKEFEDDMAGTFEGIGAEIGIRDDILTIIAPLDDMPAQLAGLKSGDKVLAIDGESTAGITIDEALRTIRGPKNTDVELTIARDGEDELLEIKITRGVIQVKSVKSELRDDGIMVIKISDFNNDTEGLFDEVVREVLKKNPKGIILDLRNNPGGYLDTAIEVSSEWVEDGVVVVEKFNDIKSNEYLARGRARLKDYPTVVLVNEGSASASEIVSGALQDYEKATIVGKKTFGKGSVQGLRSFNDGSSVKITVAKWLTPNGLCINDTGITPNEEVEYSIADFKAGRDKQLNKALEILGGDFEIYPEEPEAPVEEIEENLTQ